MQRPKMKGPFWVVLVFGRAKWTPIKGENGPIRKEIGPKGRTNKENFGLFFFLSAVQICSSSDRPLGEKNKLT